VALAAAVIHPPQAAEESCDQAHGDRAAHPFVGQAVLVAFRATLVLLVVLFEDLDALLRSLQVGFQGRRLLFQRIDDSCGLGERRFRLVELGGQALDLRLRLVTISFAGGS
jgi:hypothetical protein